MRRMLRVLKWLGLSLSTLLLAATVFCWVRSLGHRETWHTERFEPRPDWMSPELTGKGIDHRRDARMIHGHLWLQTKSVAPMEPFEPQPLYEREPFSADDATTHFQAWFTPHEQPWLGGAERAWSFAGAGFCRQRSAVDSRIDRPKIEVVTLALPFWMLAVVFGLWPVGFVAWRLLRKKRHAPGHCPHCGYDLRATPDRCPECGCVPPAPTSG